MVFFAFITEIGKLFVCMLVKGNLKVAYFCPGKEMHSGISYWNEAS